MLVQENLFLKPKQRDMIRAGVENAKFLAQKGEKTIQMLTAVNAQEADIFRQILEKNPSYFRDMKQNELKSNLRAKMAEESSAQQEENNMLEDFLEEEFKNLEL